MHVTPQTLDSYTKKCNGIEIGNYIYTFFEAECILNSIYIENRHYHNVGLGSEMLKSVIEFADKYKCKQIRAWVHPCGEFKSSTREFYTRNGFVIDKNDIGTKQLTPTFGQDLVK